MSGWIKLHRQITEHWVFQDPVKYKWWTLLLLEVNYKEKKMLYGNNLITIEPGQSIKSIRTWSEIFGTGKKATTSFFDLLEKDNMIIRETIGKGNHSTTLITITNYKDFQSVEEPLENHNGTAREPQGNHKGDTIEESKESKEGKNNIYIPAFSEFLNYAKEKEPAIVEKDLRHKYDSWKENEWRDGNNNQILNWKSKLLNTLPFLNKNYNQNKPQFNSPVL